MKKLLLPMLVLLLDLTSAPTWADGNATLAPGQWHCEPSITKQKTDKSTPFDFQILAGGETIVVKQDGATYYYEGDSPFDGGGTIGQYFKVKGNEKGGVLLSIVCRYPPSSIQNILLRLCDGKAEGLSL